MTTTEQFTPEAEKAIGQIQKLLNLAAKAGTPEEAASAAAKAQELLAKHNLDVATVERGNKDSGKREEAKVEGGFYAWQRELWESVAKLNFCYYWTQKYVEHGWAQYHPDGDKYGPTKRVWRLMTKRRHALVGRTVNTRSTIAMAQYLQQAIERLAAERLKQDGLHRFGNWAISFRKGCAETVLELLEEKRRHVLRDEERKQRAAERAAKDAAASGASTATAITLANLTQTEHDANVDFMMGEPGYSARRRAEDLAWRKEQAERRAAEEAAYTAWAAANPEEVRRLEAEERKRRERNAARRTGRRYYSSGPRDTTDYGAYRAGRDAAKAISLEPQLDSGRSSKIGR